MQETKKPGGRPARWLFLRAWLAGAFVLFFTLPALAAERITSFDATIEVMPSSDIVVEEKIDVVSEGNQITHGIFRTIPLRYRDEHGNQRSATIDVLGVSLDGRTEPYQVERTGNGVRIRIGRGDVFVEDGAHTYDIRYKSSRQLGYFDDFDEIYWNVTGDQWDFPIEKASATVILPEGAAIRSTAAYTGRQGESGQDFRITSQSGGRVTLETTRALSLREGFTVAVSWPKGFVAEPSATEKAGQYLGDNRSAAAGLIGLALLLAYFYLVWRRVGRDPEGGPIIAEYEPPEDFSPAACRFVERMGFDRTGFTAAIVNLAVKGAIRIEEEDGVFTLERQPWGDGASLAKGERAVLASLFTHDGDRLVLKNSNHATLQRAQSALKRHLNGEYEARYFRHNRMQFLPGAVIAIVTLLAMALLSVQPPFPLFLAIWTTVWSVGCYGLLTRVGSAWAGVRGARSGMARTGGFLKALVLTIMSLPFLGALLFGVFMLAVTVSVAVALLMLAVVVLCVLFYHLMKAPTLLGRRIMDRIEGFKLYLSVAEKDRMNFHNPPERTPELFETFLPYALALSVEQQWSEQFDSVLKAAALETGGGYHPAWYYGPGLQYAGFSGLGNRLSSGLGTAVATASTAPASRSSHSGSFGGGFSGGGGGGGGGGGW
jgi:hypothetical protein